MRAIACVFGLALSGTTAWADTQTTEYVNHLREEKGVASVSYAPKLEEAAKRHARDMGKNGFFGHQGSDGSQVTDRVSAVDYEWCFVAENIAKGQQDMGQVLKDWKGSSGHYRNMVAPEAREIGVARAEGDVWVMVLAAPC